MLTVFCSAGRSPGVSTAAAATALTWPGDVILAECDPAGGAALTGLCMRLLPERGLTQWALAVGRGADPVLELEQQLLAFDGPRRHLLALPPGPAPVKTLNPHWDQLAKTLTGSGADVIADIGRAGGSDTPVPLLTTADHVLLVTRPVYPDLAAANAVLRYLTSIRGHDGTRILLAGTGQYSPHAISRDLATEIIATLPTDPRTAAVLNHGVRPPKPARRPLMRAAATLAATLASTTNQAQPAEQGTRP